MFAFAGTLILNRSFARELPNDCLDALIAAPISGSALFLGKALANFVLVLAVELVSLPVFGIFYNVHWTRAVLAVAVGAGAGHLGTDRDRHHLQRADREHPAARSDAADADLSDSDSGADGRHAVDACTLVAGKPIGAENQIWLKLLVGFDVMFTAVSLVLVETVLVG